MISDDFFRVQRTVLTGVLVLGLAIIIGCRGESSREESSSTDQLPIAVGTELLGQSYEIEGADIRFQPPAGFQPAADSLRRLFAEQLQTSVAGQSKMEMVGCFLDAPHAAILLVSVIGRERRTDDTLRFFERYRHALHDVYGHEVVTENSENRGGLLVKSFRITDEASVRFQLLCRSPQGDAAELIYLIPREYYPQLMTAVNSSMASVELITLQQ